MTYDKLREWFDTYEGDPFTVAVVGALVDVAESTRTVFRGHQSCEDGLSHDAREACEALEDLETALDDTDDDVTPEQGIAERRLAS